jgi:hypothetical protein
MVKKGRFVFLFSIFLIILVSGFANATTCGPENSLVHCEWLTSQSACNALNPVCGWATTSCIGISPYMYCDDITDQYKCSSSINCGWGSGPCPYVSASATPCCNTDNTFKTSATSCDVRNSVYTCTSDIIKIEGTNQYCSGSSATCNGAKVWEVINPS